MTRPNKIVVRRSDYPNWGVRIVWSNGRIIEFYPVYKCKYAAEKSARKLCSAMGGKYLEKIKNEQHFWDSIGYKWLYLVADK